jgi:hypothetical protein
MLNRRMVLELSIAVSLVSPHVSVQNLYHILYMIIQYSDNCYQGKDITGKVCI